MNPSFFTFSITDSWMASNQLGGRGRREFKLIARLNRNGRWLNYRESQALFNWRELAENHTAQNVGTTHHEMFGELGEIRYFDENHTAQNVGTTEREVFGDTYIQIFPQVNPILYMEREDEYDDNGDENEYVWQVLNLPGYAPDGIIIRYAPGPWVELQTRHGGNTNYPDYWNNINPHFGFEQLLTPSHFGENESRSVEIVGDDNYYDTFYARHIARTRHNHTWTRFQSIVRGRRARNRHQAQVHHMNHYRAEQAHLQHLARMREEAEEARRRHRAENRGQPMDNMPHLIDNIKLKF